MHVFGRIDVVPRCSLRYSKRRRGALLHKLGRDVDVGREDRFSHVGAVGSVRKLGRDELGWYAIGRWGMDVLFECRCGVVFFKIGIDGFDRRIHGIESWNVGSALWMLRGDVFGRELGFDRGSRIEREPGRGLGVSERCGIVGHANSASSGRFDGVHANDRKHVQRYVRIDERNSYRVRVFDVEQRGVLDVHTIGYDVHGVFGSDGVAFVRDGKPSRTDGDGIAGRIDVGGRRSKRWVGRGSHVRVHGQDVHFVADVDSDSCAYDFDAYDFDPYACADEDADVGSNDEIADSRSRGQDFRGRYDAQRQPGRPDENRRGFVLRFGRDGGWVHVFEDGRVRYVFGKRHRQSTIQRTFLFVFTRVRSERVADFFELGKFRGGHVRERSNDGGSSFGDVVERRNFDVRGLDVVFIERFRYGRDVRSVPVHFDVQHSIVFGVRVRRDVMTTASRLRSHKSRSVRRRLFRSVSCSLERVVVSE